MSLCDGVGIVVSGLRPVNSVGKRFEQTSRSTVIEVHLVAVPFRGHAGGIPLAGVDPQAGALDVLAVEFPADGIAFLVVVFHPIVCAVISNVQHFLGVSVGPGDGGNLVLLQKRRVAM